MKDNTPFHKILQLDIRRNSKSWYPVIRNDWYIKFSIYRSNILLIFVSSFTGQTIIRHFIDEDEACEYINFIVSHNAATQVVV
jgi:hypothetical protein